MAAGILASRPVTVSQLWGAQQACMGAAEPQQHTSVGLSSRAAVVFLRAGSLVLRNNGLERILTYRWVTPELSGLAGVICSRPNEWPYL